MSEIIIKKRISLDFLGEDYADSYLVFKSIPIKDYDGLQKKIKTLENDSEKSFKFIQEELTSKFVEGKIKQGSDLVDVSVENLSDFPADVYLEAFSQITGKISPN